MDFECNSNLDSVSCSDFDDDIYCDSNSEFDEDDNEFVDKYADRLATFPLRLADWYNRSKPGREFMDELLTMLKEINVPVPKCTKTLMQTPKRAVQPQVMEPGEFIYFGIEDSLIEIDDPSLRDADAIVLKVSSDGVPLFKSSMRQLIPLTGEIVGFKEIPLFPIMIYSGCAKPYSADEYFHEFCSEAMRLMREGVKVTSEQINKPFSILYFGGDAPQRAWMKGVIGHTGKHGCSVCDQIGKKINGRLTYSTTRGCPRTDETFALRSSLEHHQPEFLNRPSLLESCGFGMVTQFPIETMHLIDLGIQKKTLKMIVNKECNLNVTVEGLIEMERKLLELYHYIPRAEFARRPRTFTELCRWKATEGRLFALYIGIVVLKDNVQEEMYNHFLHLTCAYRLISTSDAQVNCKTADTLFGRYVENFGAIYGEDRLSYNVHNLLHICEYVMRYGAVDEFAAYRNENYQQLLKGFVRKPTKILQQISNRMEEVKHLKNEITTSGFIFEGRPLYPGCPTYHGYKFDSFLLRSSMADAYCQISPDIQFRVERFVTLVNGEKIVVGRRFLKCEPFFDYPMDSREVGIFMCYNLSQQLEVFPINLIQSKLINLPYKDKNVLVAMLHHIK